MELNLAVAALALTSTAYCLTPDEGGQIFKHPSPWASTSPFVPTEALNATFQNNLHSLSPCIAAPGLLLGEDGYVSASLHYSLAQDTRHCSLLPGRAGSSSVDDMAYVPQIILHSPATPNLSSSFQSTTTFQPVVLGIKVYDSQVSCSQEVASAHQHDHPVAATKNVTASSFQGSTKRAINLVPEEFQPPLVIYQPPQKKTSRGRHSQRASSINTEGLWIDRDDLCTSTGWNGGMIEVHKCRWAESGDPCGMWIIGSRSCVGAHIWKWHPKSWVTSTVKCRWSRCNASKAMLKDWIGRHVVTVHLEEVFKSQGCSQEFPQKDVYDKHAKTSEACRDAGVVITYGTERRIIDVPQVLQRGYI